MTLCHGTMLLPPPHLPVSAPRDWFSNSTICCSRSISTISGATSSRKVVLAIQAALPVDLQDGTCTVSSVRREFAALPGNTYYLA